MTDKNDEIRENAVVDQPPRTFQGIELAPYTAGRDAIVRSMARNYPGLGVETDAWTVIFVLAHPVTELVTLSRDLDKLQEAVITWADTFPHSARIEAMQIAGEIWKELHAVETKIEPAGEGGPGKKAQPTPAN
jgi:hypothetical protein